MVNGLRGPEFSKKAILILPLFPQLVPCYESQLQNYPAGIAGVTTGYLSNTRNDLRGLYHQVATIDDEDFSWNSGSWSVIMWPVVDTKYDN